MALAVFGFVVLPWVSDARGDHDVAAGSDEAGGGSGQKVELPDVMEVHCAPGTITVPVASIRPQDDGLHIDVTNDLADEIWMWVRADTGWDSGRFTVASGASSVVVTPPPGALQVGCDVGEILQRQVDLVDVDHVFSEQGLDCPTDKQATSAEVIPAPNESSVMPTAVRDAIGDTRMAAGDHTETASGYREASYKAHTLHPAVRLVRDGDTIAIIHLNGTLPAHGPEDEDLTPRAPWVSVGPIDYCPPFLDPIDPTDTTTEGRTPA
jgi:hypothetical protein